MGHDIEDGGLALFLQETGIDSSLGYAALGGKGPHLIVGKVTGMIA